MPLFSYPIALSRGVSNFLLAAPAHHRVSSPAHLDLGAQQSKLRAADFYAAARSTARLAQLVTGHQCPVKIRTLVPLRMSQRFRRYDAAKDFNQETSRTELVSEYLRRVSPECSRVCSLSAVLSLSVEQREYRFRNGAGPWQELAENAARLETIEFRRKRDAAA